eukprot:1152812-Pelagomonas_calceolata.AAC.3
MNDDDLPWYMTQPVMHGNDQSIYPAPPPSKQLSCSICIRKDHGLKQGWVIRENALAHVF